MTYTIDNGLIVNTSTTPPTCLGYIMQFGDKGNYSPNGKVSIDLTPADVETHNKLLSQADWSGMLKHGRGILYYKAETKEVINWNGDKRIPATRTKKGRHNIAGERLDVWFELDNSIWHGVQIGQNGSILRVRRTKDRK